MRIRYKGVGLAALLVALSALRVGAGGLAATADQTPQRRNWGCGKRPLPDSISPTDAKKTMAQADVIFAGRVTAIHDPIPLTAQVPQADLYLDYEFAVHRLWKGKGVDTLWVRSYRDPASGGFPFRMGEMYLVYAFRDASHLWTNRCCRTTRVGAAYGDLYRLGNPIFDSGSGLVPDIRLHRLLRQLRLKNPSLRLQSLRVLEEIAPADSSVVPAMLKIFEDSTVVGRPDIAAAFGRMGKNAAPAVPALVRALHDPNPTLRVMAGAALGRLGDVARDAVPALLATLQGDSDPVVRAVAAQSLGALGPTATKAIPALRNAMTDDNARVRNAAATALQNLEGAKQ